LQTNGSGALKTKVGSGLSILSMGAIAIYGFGLLGELMAQKPMEINIHSESLTMEELRDEVLNLDNLAVYGCINEHTDEGIDWCITVPKHFGEFKVWQVNQRDGEIVDTTQGNESVAEYDEYSNEEWYHLDLSNMEIKGDSWNFPTNSWVKIGFEFCFLQ
jgi:hypothetical protein